ncbi:uncharacterized protein LOC144865525 [Branchiostoma floridae x Branchiostoma japonicum]
MSFTCDSGYELDGSATITCQADRTWTDSAPSCPRVQCPLLAAPDNGQKSGENYYQDVLTFWCDLGYELVGPSSMTCQADRTWSDIVPTCARVQCPALQSPTNGGSSGSNYYQDVMSFTCDSGYELDGSATITCQADRTWTDSAPSCPRVQCPLLAAPDNGQKSGENYYQDVLTFWCDLGYELVGPSSMTCQADRTWSDIVPTCARVQCPALQSPTNGGSSGSNYYQDVMSFTCDSGYELDGSATITCQADRTWSDSAPRCPPVQCPLLAAPDNGQQSGENYYQDVLTFWCDPGYEMVGLPSLTCQADRTWTGDVPTCTRVQCPVLSSPVNGISSGSNFYQDVVTSTCDLGYNLAGDSSSTCQADQTWSSNTPSCNDVDECNIGNDGCQQNCNNIVGSYWCSCGTGYRLNSDSRTCADVDECSGANGGCAQTCTNTISSFYCSCGHGYSLNTNGYVCDDVDECASANGGCEQHCTNNIGSFDCSCSTGYRLNSDGLACDDVNECDIANGGCDQTCTNSVGSFQCSCRIGYTLNGDGLSCDDVDECHTANGGCEQTCSNTIGSFQCICDNGYVLNEDGFACNDVDECDTANGGCGQICNNTIGSFECLCHYGYILNIDGFACDGFDPMSRLTCLSTTTTSISVSWTKPVAHIMGYSVMYIPVSGFSQSSLMTSFLSRNDTNVTISGLFSGVQYSLTVLSFGLWNDSANADVECITDLPPPMNFTFSHVTENSANFHWQKPVSALVVAYRVWLIDKETTLTVSTQYLLDSATSTAFTYLTPATEYVVAITCISPSVEGPQASVTIITDTDPPWQLLVDDIRYSSLALSWIPPVAKLSDYQLTYSSAEQRRERRALSYVTLPGDIATYWLHGLVPATQYTISLTAVSRFGRSETIDLTATTGTDPPTELKVKTVSSSWLHVVWTPPVAAVISYDLTVTDDTSQEKIHLS